MFDLASLGKTSTADSPSRGSSSGARTQPSARPRAALRATPPPALLTGGRGAVPGGEGGARLQQRLPAPGSGAGMAAFLRRESSVEGAGAASCTGAFLFGCELNSRARSYTFKVSEQDDSDHTLALNTVCLSEGAKDECNIVEVVGHNYHNQEIAVPVANLKLSCQPWLSLNDFQLQPPVTFRLCSGSGPVHIAGLHQIFHRQDLLEDGFSEDDEDFSEEEEFSDEEELPPVKPAKKKQRKS